MSGVRWMLGLTATLLAGWGVVTLAVVGAVTVLKVVVA